MALDIMNQAVAALGTGIASSINLLDIDTVIVSGGLGIRLGQPYADRIAKATNPDLFLAERAPQVKVAFGSATTAGPSGRRSSSCRRQRHPGRRWQAPSAPPGPPLRGPSRAWCPRAMPGRSRRALAGG